MFIGVYVCSRLAKPNDENDMTFLSIAYPFELLIFVHAVWEFFTHITIVIKLFKVNMPTQQDLKRSMQQISRDMRFVFTEVELTHDK